MSSFLKKTQNTAFHHSLFEKNSKIFVAVSGGPDSVCLLDVLCQLQKKYHLKLAIAHVNYRLRDKDSDADEKFVRELSQKYQLEIHVLQPKISGKANLESRLRDIRYDFFEQLRQQYRFDSIAVAHNANDQVETFFLRLLRGAGLSGLSAMKFKTNSIIRPLLFASRREILEYLQERDLHYRVDKTNLEQIFFRNKIRHDLIPYIEKHFNPGISRTIFDTAAIIAEDYSFLRDLAKEYVQKNAEIRIKSLLRLHPSLARMVILEKISQIRPHLREIESSHIEEILKAIRSNKGKSQVVRFKSLKMTRKGDRVIIEKYKD